MRQRFTLATAILQSSEPVAAHLRLSAEASRRALGIVYVVCSPDVLGGGEPTVAGTRIAVSTLQALTAQGASEQELRKDYHVRPQVLRAVLWTPPSGPQRRRDGAARSGLGAAPAREDRRARTAS